MIGWGPSNYNNLNITSVDFLTPVQSIEIKATFNVNKNASMEYFYAELPYTITKCHMWMLCDDSTRLYSSNMGKGYYSYLNTTLGSSIINAKININQTAFSSSRPGESIGIEVEVHVKQSLFSMNDWLSGSKTLAYTFYGNFSSLATRDMRAYFGTNNTYAINRPFSVGIELPSSYYLTNSQTTPTAYYVSKGDRWLTFSMDFPPVGTEANDYYAQTLFISIENTASPELLTNLLIFLIGVFSTISISFAIEVVTVRDDKKKKNKRKRSKLQNPSTGSDI